MANTQTFRCGNWTTPVTLSRLFSLVVDLPSIFLQRPDAPTPRRPGVVSSRDKSMRTWSLSETVTMWRKRSVLDSEGRRDRSSAISTISTLAIGRQYSGCCCHRHQSASHSRGDAAGGSKKEAAASSEGPNALPYLISFSVSYAGPTTISRLWLWSKDRTCV